MANRVIAKLINKTPRGQETTNHTKRYVDNVIGLSGNFFSDSANGLYDPAAVTLAFTNPAGSTTTYTYGTDAQLVKRSTGDYYVLVTADKYGRWSYTWTGTGGITGSGYFFAGINPAPTR